ncbi:MAG: phosphopantetheine-binding protein [Chloroflexi bacterium]|nr:phosphopantetheine-binding protein [Chloroflexota bacterium]
MQGVKEQLKPIIVNSLRITDLSPEELRDDQPLMGGDLEIDSIDILQLILEIERHFGIRLVTGKLEPEVWKDINSLAATIEARLAETSHG